MSKVAKYISVWSEIKENCYSLLKESLIQIGFISDKLQLNLNDGTWRKINNDKNANFNNNLHLIFNYISNDNLYFPSETSMSLAKQYEETINSRLTKYEYFNSYIEYDNKDIYPHTSTLSSIANLLYSTKSKNYTTFWKNNILKKLNYDDLDIVKTKSTTDSLNYLSVYMRYKGY
jgi:hypothetical protein